MKVYISIIQTKIVQDVSVNIPDMDKSEVREWIANSNIVDNQLDYAETETKISVHEIE